MVPVRNLRISMIRDTPSSLPGKRSYVTGLFYYGSAASITAADIPILPSERVFKCFRRTRPIQKNSQLWDRVVVRLNLAILTWPISRIHDS